jgi:hypothetical protein
MSSVQSAHRALQCKPYTIQSKGGRCLTLKVKISCPLGPHDERKKRKTKNMPDCEHDQVFIGARVAKHRQLRLQKPTTHTYTPHFIFTISLTEITRSSLQSKSVSIQGDKKI